MKKQMLLAVLCMVGFLTARTYESGYVVDVVGFSYDRPLQLYSLLESMTKYFKSMGVVTIIYRTSGPAYEAGYELVKKDFPGVNFVKQGHNPHADFKPLLMKWAFETPARWIMFAVDDIIATDYVDLARCAQLLEKTGAYGFYLRLGKNITQCYMRGSVKTPVPPHERVCEGVYQYVFKDAVFKSDWGWPSSVDMTVFDKKDLIAAYRAIEIPTPSYEGAWLGLIDMRQRGLFFEHSKMVNIPLNLVNEQFRMNRFMRSYNITELLNIFMQGEKVDINKFYQINNVSPHAEYELSFVKRG